jgi:hypothetical protein
MPARSLIVDSRGPSERDRVRSRSEALQRLTAARYDTIELHTTTPGRDDYELVAYLSGIWPAYLQHVTVRTITQGRTSAEWNHATGRFVLAPPRPRRSRSVPHSAGTQLAAARR